MNPGDDYQVWLLRIWQDSGADEAVRCSLEAPRSGQRRGFATLDDLFNFLVERHGPGQFWDGRDDELTDSGDA